MRKKATAVARFYFSFLPFSHWKWSYYEVLIIFKKKGNTICEPYHFLKNIFSIRHNGVKSFWTEVRGFPPIPLLLGLNWHSFSEFCTQLLLQLHSQIDTVQRSTKNLVFFAFFYVLCKRMLHSMRSFMFFAK